MRIREWLWVISYELQEVSSNQCSQRNILSVYPLRRGTILKLLLPLVLVNRKIFLNQKERI